MTFNYKTGSKFLEALSNVDPISTLMSLGEVDSPELTYNVPLPEWVNIGGHYAHFPSDIQFMWLMITDDDQEQNIESFMRVVEQTKPRHWTVLSNIDVNLTAVNKFVHKAEIYLQTRRPKAMCINTTIPIPQGLVDEGIFLSAAYDIPLALLRHV
jgi:hypothetical protein